jgi:hypothetical protein
LVLTHVETLSDCNSNYVDSDSTAARGTVVPEKMPDPKPLDAQVPDTLYFVNSDEIFIPTSTGMSCPLSIEQSSGLTPLDHGGYTSQNNLRVNSLRALDAQNLETLPFESPEIPYQVYREHCVPGALYDVEIDRFSVPTAGERYPPTTTVSSVEPFAGSTCDVGENGLLNRSSRLIAPENAQILPSRNWDIPKGEVRGIQGTLYFIGSNRVFVPTSHGMLDSPNTDESLVLNVEECAAATSLDGICRRSEPVSAIEGQRLLSEEYADFEYQDAVDMHAAETFHSEDSNDAPAPASPGMIPQASIGQAKTILTRINPGRQDVVPTENQPPTIHPVIFPHPVLENYDDRPLSPPNALAVLPNNTAKFKQAKLPNDLEYAMANLQRQNDNFEYNQRLAEERGVWEGIVPVRAAPPLDGNPRRQRRMSPQNQEQEHEEDAEWELGYWACVAASMSMVVGVAISRFAGWGEG